MEIINFKIKFFVFHSLFILINEQINSKIIKSSQQEGSKVFKILKFEPILCCDDNKDNKLVTIRTGGNLPSLYRSKLITKSPKITSDC